MEETEKEGVRELFAVVVKLLLTRSVCCLVYGQRKESCNVGVPTIVLVKYTKNCLLQNLKGTVHFCCFRQVFLL